jgi:hypothetical protein
MHLVAVNSYFCVLLWQICFVLRKKNDQITTLHVFHHAIMPMGMWIAVKFAPGTVRYLNCAHDSTSCNVNDHVN